VGSIPEESRWRVVWIEERAAREIRHVRAPRAGSSPFGRSRTQPEEQPDEGAVASPPAQFRIVRAGVIELRASVGNPASGNSDEPSGQYVYITRLPYECQTKLPNTSDTDWGPYAIGIRAGYDPNSPGQSQGAASARQERRLHDDFRRDSRGDRSFHRREVRAGLHPQAHDRTAKRECRRSPAAREVGRLRVCRGRGPQRGPRVCPTSAPQGHGRGRAIGRRGGKARTSRGGGRGGPRRGRPGWEKGGGPRRGSAPGNRRFPTPFGPPPPRAPRSGGVGRGGNPVLASLPWGSPAPP